MRGSTCIDRPICGVFLSKPPAPLPLPLSSTASPASQPRPSFVRCMHSRRDQDTHSTDGRRMQSPVNWGGVFTRAAADPAAGTLLPLLAPHAWAVWARRRLQQPLVGGSGARLRNPPAAVCPTRIPSAVRSRHTQAAASTGRVAVMPTANANDAGFWRQRRPTLSKDELLSFVDPPSDGDSVDEHLAFIRDPYLRRYAPAAGPEVSVSEMRGGDDGEYPSWHDVRQLADEVVLAAVDELSRVVVARLRNPSAVGAAEVYECYRRLPGKRMAWVPAGLRHQLLKALGMVEKKDAQSMLRYFAVVGDVKDSGFSLWRAEWNAAISFASRYVGLSTAAEAEAAVRLWREMEQDAHMRANEVTFNILFDVASKAGNFTLAEMVYQEMEKRGHRFNRYHHVSLIHFFGLKMDSDGVRAAYQEMVYAGEMIDVLVLNCVIAGFLRCGEEDAARRLYRRMWQTYVDRLRRQAASSTGTSKTAKNSEESAGSAADTGTAATEKEPPADPESAEWLGNGATVLPMDAEHQADVGVNSADAQADAHADSQPDTQPDAEAVAVAVAEAAAEVEAAEMHMASSLTSQKAMTHVLMLLAKVSKGDAAMRASYQHLVPTRPDLATYRILINHYTVRLGDLATVTQLLHDMKTLRIPLHGAIFLALFKGFALHGGRPGTGSNWSEQRLNSIWAALLRALDDETTDLYISTWLVVWVLRAFDRCSTPERVFKAYTSLSSRWQPTEADADFAISFLHNLLKNRGSGRASMLGQLGSQAFG